MFCPRCGTKIELSNSNFCYKCGLNISEFQQASVIDSNINNEVTTPKKEVEEIPPSPDQDKNKEESQPKNLSASQQQPEHNILKPLPSSLTESSIYKTSRWDNLKDKWGSGWLFFGWLFFSPQASKYYDSLNTDFTLKNVIPLLSFCMCMVVYYYSRQILSGKIERSWVRSTIAVLIAYAIYFLASILLYIFILKPESNTSYLSEKSTSQESSSWKIITLTNANVKIESPFDLKEISVPVPEEAKDLIQKNFSYSYGNNAFNIRIDYVKYKKGTVINLDNYKSTITSAYNKSKDISNFECSLTKTTKDSLEGRILNGSAKIKNIEVKIFGVVYYSGLEIWQVISSNTTPEYENIVQRIINSIHIENKIDPEKKYYNINLLDVGNDRSQLKKNELSNNLSKEKKAGAKETLLKNKVFLIAEIDNSFPKINEEFNVKYTLYTKVDISSPTILTLPTFSGLIAKQVPLMSLYFGIVKYNGERFRAAIVSKYIVKANRKGIYLITPYVLKIPIVRNKQNHLYDSYEIKSDPITLKVL